MNFFYRTVVLIFILSFNSFIFTEKKDIRQIIVSRAPLYLKPGLRVSKLLKSYSGRRLYRRKRMKTYISGGKLIGVLGEKWKNNIAYIKFKYKKNIYYIKKIYSGKKPYDVRPLTSFPIGKEKFLKPVPFHYEPPDLKELTVYTAGDNRVYLRRAAAVSFISMVLEAKLYGIKLAAVRGYQSVAMYSRNYFRLRKIWGEKYIPWKMNVPGESKLHTGVYVDVSCKQNRYIADDHFVYTRAYKWLLDNSQFYGFHFLKFNNPVDYRSFRLRYTGRTSLIFKIQRALKYKTSFRNETIILKKFKRKGLDVNFFVVHDNENSATRALKYALKRYGGYAVELVNVFKLNYRNIVIPAGREKLEVDPNRIFTDYDALRDMKMWNERSRRKNRKKALRNLKVIRKAILKAVKFKKKRYLIVIHSNKRYGRLSIYSFLKRSIRRRYHIYINRKQSRKAFYFVTSKKDYLFFKKKRMNVVCPKKWDGKDGSLGYVALQNNYPYIVIEAAETDDVSEKRLVDAAIVLVKKRYARWKKF